MAKTRETPCVNYVCAGQCMIPTRADKASMKGYCQTCDKYRPRAKVRHENRKKRELDRLNRRIDHVC